MKKYVYVRVCISSANPCVMSTDPSVLEWIITEIKKQISTITLNMVGKDLLGGMHEIWLSKLNGQDSKVTDWIIRMLCEDSYEPFAVEHHDYLHFRKLVET